MPGEHTCAHAGNRLSTVRKRTRCYVALATALAVEHNSAGDVGHNSWVCAYRVKTTASCGASRPVASKTLTLVCGHHRPTEGDKRSFQQSQAGISCRSQAGISDRNMPSVHSYRCETRIHRQVRRSGSSSCSQSLAPQRCRTTPPYVHKLGGGSWQKPPPTFSTNTAGAWNEQQRAHGLASCSSWRPPSSTSGC
jgi:hypothetical protein